MSAGGEGVESLCPPGAEDWRRGHLGVGALLRAGTATDLPADYHRPAAALGGGIVRRRLRLSHEDEKLPASSAGQAFDMAVDASAQPGLNRRRVIQVGLAERQQPSFQSQLGGGRRCSEELVDGASPPAQPVIVGVDGPEVVDVPQQMRPAALLGAVVVMAGGVAVADQRSGKLIAQDFIDDRLASSPSQKVPQVGSAEGPHVAVVPVLPPARLIGVNHRTAADAFQDGGRFSLGLAGRLLRGVHDGAQAEAEPVHRVQCHWIVRNGNRASSRRAAIRLTMFTPGRRRPQLPD